MLRNYLKITFRNFLTYKVYSSINVFGLSIGIACALLIGLYVGYETSYDHFHEHADRIFRVSSIVHWGNEDSYGRSSSDFLAKEIRNELRDEVEMAVMFKSEPGHISIDKEHTETFFDQDFLLAEPQIFEVFDFDWIAGAAAQALEGPNKLVLSASAAERYFPEEEALGKSLLLTPTYGNDDQKINFIVSGIVENYPSNSELSFEFLVSYDSFSLLHDEKYRGWRNIGSSTFVILKDPEQELAFNQKLNDHIRHLIEDDQGEVFYEHFLQPLTDIHLDTRETGVHAKGSLKSIYIFSSIAILVLLIACINFMNLTTARASVRVKEIGVRTVLGAKRTQLMSQFLSEAMFYTVIAMALAWVLVDISVPVFNELFRTKLNTSLLTQPKTCLLLIGFTLLLGFLAGSYPAIYMSAMGTRLLRGQAPQSSVISLRKLLVVVQFSASIVLIVGSIVIYQQLKYVQSKDLGFNKEMVMYLPLYGEAQQNKYQAWKTALASIPAVRSVSVSNSRLGGYFMGNGIQTDTTQDDHMLQVLSVDPDYLEVMELQLLNGHWFEATKATDLSEGFVINEAAAAYFGWTNESAYSKYLSRNNQKGQVIGVVKDFHFTSLHKSIEPLIMFVGSYSWDHSKLVLKLAAEDLPNTLQQIEKVWQQFELARGFSYTFLDDFYAKQYESDIRFGQIFGLFAMIAILIACLGLLGLVAFAAAMRSKEIGIRKVLGAAVYDILMLLGKDFSKLVIIAFLVAVPLSWFSMNKWLETFSYRIDIHIGIFIMAALLTAFIALITMGWNAYRAASVNPVEVLRNE